MLIHKVPLHDLMVVVQYNVTATKITGPISFSGSLIHTNTLDTL